MARSITFNAITKYKPGGITSVRAGNVSQVLANDNSIIGLIGEADGGQPGSESGLIALSDDSRARDIFRSGPLADAISLAFGASNDPDVPGGASRVYVYKTNASTKASLSLPCPVPDTEFSGDASGGSTTTIVDSSLSTTYADDYFNGMYVVLRPFTSTVEARLVSDYVAGTNTMTVATLANAAANADDYQVFRADQFELVDALDSSTSTVLTLLDVTMVADEHIGRWVYVQNTETTGYYRQITDNSTTTITISPPLPAAPTAGAFVFVLPNSIDLESRDWGVHTNGVSVEVSTGVSSGSKIISSSFEGQSQESGDLGGKMQLSVLYKGGLTSVSDTTAAGSTTTVINSATGGFSVNAYAGRQIKVGSYYTEVVSNTASAFTVSPPLPVAPAAGVPALVQNITSGVMQLTGSAGKATLFTSTVSNGDNLSIPVTSSMTLRSLINVINQNSNYLATAGRGVNPDTVKVSDFDFGYRSRAKILASATIATAGLTRNTMSIVDGINATSSWLVASRSSDTGSTKAGQMAPGNTVEAHSLSGGSRGVSASSDFQAGFDALLTVRCNSVVPLIDQDLAEEGNSSTASFASVAAQAAAHVAAARGAYQEVAGERGAFLGMRGTKSAIIAQANDLNDMDVQLVAQNPTVLNADGELEELGPRMLAVMAASMRAGVFEVATPLTHKLIRTSGLTNDSSWDPKDLTDANDLIINGVLFAETVQQGTRWVRDITTWVGDDALYYSEGSVRDAVRYVAYGLRTFLVERFIGDKASPATAASLKEAAVSWLDLARTDSIIVDSTDPLTGGTLRAYHNLSVVLDGDVARISVCIFPVPGINFILNSIFLKIPSQSV